MIVRPSFRGLILTFFRRKVTFMLIFGMVCLAGAGYLLVQTPQYMSSGELVLRFNQNTVPDIDRTRNPQQPLGSGERREILYSDVDILRSPDLARMAINAVGLGDIYPQIAADGHTESRQMDKALNAFKADMVIDVGPQSDVITVSFLNPDANIAHKVVQNLLDRFFAREAAIYANPQLQFAEAEAKKAQANLVAAQNALTQFRQSNKIFDLDTQLKELLQQRADVESRLNVVKGQEAQLNQINQRLAELNMQRSKYEDLQRTIRIQDDTYRTLAMRAEEAHVEATRNAEKISAAAVIAEPSIPQLPARPRRKLLALATLLSAIILATGAVLGTEALDDRLRSPRDVVHILRVPVLATFDKEA